MYFIDILTLSLSILGVHDLILYFCLLLPRNLIPRVAVPLTEAREVLRRAQSIGVIPHASEYAVILVTFENEFLRLRVESHRSPTIFQQLLCAIWSGLTYRLYALSFRIDAIKVKLELAADEQQLESITTGQRTTSTALLNPAAATAIPMNGVAEPLHLQPDATC